MYNGRCCVLELIIGLIMYYAKQIAIMMYLYVALSTTLKDVKKLKDAYVGIEEMKYSFEVTNLLRQVKGKFNAEGSFEVNRFIH